MRLRVFTATRALEELGITDPGAGPLSGHLLRPFLDLTGAGGSINARIARYAGESIGDSADAAEWVPPQGNTKVSLRANLILETGLNAYHITWPNQLPTELRSAAWERLCEEVENVARLSSAERYRLVCTLYKLGLFEAAVSVGAAFDDERLAGDQFVGLTLLRVASAMSKRGQSTHDVVRHSLRVYELSQPTSRPRLAAAINLGIHFARATRDKAAVRLWTDRIRLERAALRPELEPVDALMTSIALRAESFGPFTTGDMPAVATKLDETEYFARQALVTGVVPPVVAAENLYAVLETRTNAAVAAGDREAALRYVSELVRHDPLEPRAWLQLGNVHWDDRRIEPALDAYQTAAMLGAPFTATAWYCVARCFEALSEPEQARTAYASSVNAEPLGITGLTGLRRTASATGEAALAEWADRRLNQLRQRIRTAAAAEHVATTN
jgi:tetratricopeptide (TPR) repeat protein